ncbi:malonyl-CoA/methylmalonyl-CoA synthetase [Cognatiyoonia koreensis]|uniref:Malonyl-CoA/methylmalonyl-CoA synthetase n=1 Tax=Cognatiyoonia koreensis TaxID=364200 RepID=A0A1I0RAZ0_9RHOB|nr:malonyl-CoA synthase [Cognatiyoonia koreensis]SEW37951.1 malonyl-CoA/methylmalonyl-CoA synthetase [Cognatiyoonia koreensis]
MTNPLFDALFAPHVTNDAPFLHLADGSTQSYRAFMEQVARFAGMIVEKGLGVGDRLALRAEKSPAALAVYAACMQRGVIFLPLNPAYTTDELRYFVEDSGAKLFVSDDPAAHAGLAPQVIALNADHATPCTEVAARLPDDLAAFLYTSGTTGRSKGAMLTQDNLLSNARVLTDYWQFTQDDVLLHALPIFHTHGLFVATNITLLTGGSMIFLPKFDIDQMIAHLPRATSMMGVPTFYTRLLQDARFDHALTKHMRLFISGSAPMLAETHSRMKKRTGHRVLERYGMTETNMSTSNPYDGERRAGTVGLPLPGVELKICDPQTGEVLPTGNIGVIEVRGPNVFKGYWQMPDKTAQELRSDGFFITGDLGFVDADGYVTIVGRGKDLIISGGFNIYPKEVEQVIDDQPGILESAVIGVSHADLGEGVVAIVVADGPLDLDDLRAVIAAKLARFKQPRKIILVHALPRNTMGKVQKNVLRDTYADVFLS